MLPLRSETTKHAHATLINFLPLIHSDGSSTWVPSARLSGFTCIFVKRARIFDLTKPLQFVSHNEILRLHGLFKLPTDIRVNDERWFESAHRPYEEQPTRVVQFISLLLQEYLDCAWVIVAADPDDGSFIVLGDAPIQVYFAS